MKKFIVGFIVIFIAIFALNSDFLGNRKIKTFSVTADTNVSQVKGLSKYVSQEEVDSFAFRHWDIDTDKVMNNDKMENSYSDTTGEWKNIRSKDELIR